MDQERNVLAFAVSPPVGALVFAVLVGALDGGPPRLGLVVTAAMLAYAASVLVGVPLFLLTRDWRHRSILFYVTAATATAALPILTFGILTHDNVLPALAVVGSAAAGITFWVVADR